MNISSLNGTNVTSEIVVALDLVREIIGNYGSRGISVVGTLVNLFGLLALRNRNLEEKFYDCLYCRCFCNLVVCLLESYHSQTPCMECQGDYIMTCLQIYFYYPWTRIAFMASIICDILLIFSRLLLLLNKRDNMFFTLSKKVFILFTISHLKYI